MRGHFIAADADYQSQSILDKTLFWRDSPQAVESHSTVAHPSTAPTLPLSKTARTISRTLLHR